MLLGRDIERAKIDALLNAVRAGESAALVVVGAPGIGKTALLDDAAARAEGYGVLRAAGAESESELAFAALHQLCTPLFSEIEMLPPPQRDALRTAFGLRVGSAPDRFLVGLAVLTLLSDAAASRPLLSLVDDAQWLDRSSAQVLAFVARRLQGESVLLVFAQREEEGLEELSGLAELRLDGLSEIDARELLASPAAGPFDERSRDRIIAEAAGNPLALLELPRGLFSASLAGGFELPEGAPLGTQIEAGFRRRVEQLPKQTQRLLLIGAAEPVGDPLLLWRAAAELGIPVEAAAPAEADDLIEIAGTVRFRHPLLRSTIYRAARPEQRREVHRALAAATDPETAADRRAWHRAQATLAPDESIAAELELSAGRAQARGGVAAAAAFLERSAELTPEPLRRAERTLSAAQAKRLAGLPDAAEDLLAAAARDPLSDLDRAMSQRLRGQIALDLGHGVDAAALLLDAAQALGPLDARLARQTHLEALWAASNAGRFGSGVEVAARAARRAPPAPQPPRAADLLVDGLAVMFTDSFVDGAPILKRALAEFREELGRDEHTTPLPWMAARVAAELLDDDTWNLLASRHVQVARNTGAFSLLPVTLGFLAALRVHEGDFAAGASLLDEADTIGAALGTQPKLPRLLLASYRGDEVGASLLADAVKADATARGEGTVLTACEFTSAILHNGLGHYQAAFAAAQQATALDELSAASWSLPELAEAAVRSGRHQAAAEAVERLSPRTRAAGTEFARGVEARTRALVSEGTAADSDYGEAIELLGRTRMRFALARAHLLYGEWLRRESRRVDAREQLRRAHAMFTEMGADSFAERAGRELLATGETVRRRSVETRDDLTAQEAEIARLAAEGHTNSEIGGQLFLSRRTVEWHLRKVYAKLDISSRRQLRLALAKAGRTSPQSR